MARDVRMRGFAQRSTVEDALAWIDKLALTQTTEVVDLAHLAGRVLAEDVTSRIDVPGFDRAMMDGFALRASNTEGADTYQPVMLQVVGQSLPGHPFDGQVEEGGAVRIMTGAPLPAGANAVIPVEKVNVDEVQVTVLEALPVDKNVARVGEDIRAGEVVLERGRQLRPQDVGLLASIGLGSAAVVRPPRVRVIVTGNELLPAGEVPGPHQIVDSNSPMLSALISRDGGNPNSSGILPDEPEVIRQAFDDEVEVFLVSGGSSVGAEDFAPQIVAERGELPIHGIAMRPSSPAGMGTVDGRPVFLLPGNPVSCLCAYDFFAGRVIRRLAGRPSTWPYPSANAQLTRKLVSAVGRTDYARVRLADNDGARLEVEPLAIRGASILSSTTRADGFVIVPADSEGYPSRTEVTVYFYDEPRTVS